MNVFVDRELFDKVEGLHELAMYYETSVMAFGREDYLNQFFRFYRIRNRTPRPVPSTVDFYESLKEVSGDGRSQPIAAETVRLFGLPERVMVFEVEDIRRLTDEMEGPRGCGPFFFNFDIMFCEYRDFTLCFISGTNN